MSGKMSHLSLDARAILEYLNELGYRNITADQLKEFLKDLRKLIKYEETLGVNIHQDGYFHNLFRRTTASYRAKHDKENICTNRPQEPENPFRNLDRKQKLAKETKFVNAALALTAQSCRLPGRPSNKEQTEAISATTKTATTQPRPVVTLAMFPQNGGKETVGELGRIFQESMQISQDQSKKPNAFEIVSESKKAQCFKTACTRVGRQAGDGHRGESGSLSRTASREAPDSAGQGDLATASKAKGPKRERSRGRRKGRSPDSMKSGQSPRKRDRSKFNRAHRKPLGRDPVALYQYYQEQWKLFRKQIPGETTHSSLRWEVHHKLLADH